MTRKASIEIKDSVRSTSDAHLDYNYEVDNNSQRDLLITQKQIKKGHVIFHVEDDERYRLKNYPTIGSLVGVTWEIIKKGILPEEVNQFSAQQHFEINVLPPGENVLIDLNESLFHSLEVDQDTVIDVENFQEGCIHTIFVINDSVPRSITFSSTFSSNSNDIDYGTEDRGITVLRFATFQGKLMLLRGVFTETSPIVLGTPTITSTTSINILSPGIRVTWTGVVGATQYFLEYKSNVNLNTDWIPYSENPLSSTTVDIIFPPAKYSFRVRAFDGTNYSSWSPTALHNLEILQPTGLNVVNVISPSEGVFATWNPVSDAEYYSLDYRPFGQTEYNDGGTSLTNSFFLPKFPTGAQGGINYFIVTAYSAGVPSVPSEEFELLVTGDAILPDE